MNTSHRTLWNAALSSWVAVPETASAQGNGRSRTRTRSIGAALRRTLLGAALALAWAMPAAAATLYWDVNNALPGLGGTAVWNTTAAFWNTDATGTGGTATFWTNAPLNDAVFDGPAGAATVTITAPVSASNLTFGAVPTYTLTGSTLTLGGAAPTISTLGGTHTISSVLAGTAGVIKTAAGTLLVTGTNTYTGSTTVSAGTFSVGNGGTAGLISSASPISVSAGATVQWNNSNTVPASVIANTLTGTGTVQFQGQNATTALQTSTYDNNGDWSGFSGDIVLNRAILWNTTAQSQVGTGTIRVQDRGTMAFNGGTFSNNLVLETGAGWHHNVSGSDVVIGAIRLEGSNTLSGNITLNGAANPITLGDPTGANSTIGSYAGGTQTLSGVISGTGGLAMSRYTAWNGGAPVTTNIDLTGTSSNTYTGTTVVDGQGGVASLRLMKTGGAVAIAANNVVQFGSATGGQANLRIGETTATGAIRNQWNNQFGAGVAMNFVNASGQWGRFDLQGTDQTLAGLNAGALTVQGGAVIQNQNLQNFDPGQNATLTLNGSGNYLYNGFIRDQDNSGTTRKLNLVKNGSGSQTLAGSALFYTGTTAVNAGRLVLSDASNFRSATTVDNGAKLSWSGTGAFGVAATHTIALNSGSTLENLNPAAWTVLSGAITNAGTTTINQASNATSAAVAGFYLDGGLKGNGTVTINAANAGSGVNFRNNNTTFAGTMVVNGIASATAFGGSGIGVGGCTICLANTDITLNGTIELLNQGIGWANTASGAFGMGALSGNGVMVGNFTGGGGVTTVTLGNTNNSGTFSGTIANGTGNTVNVVKTGTGTQTFTGANTFSGYALVQGGILSVSAVNQLGTGLGANGIFVRSGGTLRYTGTGSESTTLRNISWDSGAATVDVASPTANLTLAIAGGTRSQAFTKQGAGTLTLQKTTAINDFTGGALTIAGGILEYAQNNAGAISRFGGAVTGAAGTQIKVSGTGYIGNDALTANWSANLASLDIGTGAAFDLRGQGIVVDALTGNGTLANSYQNGVDNLVVGANGGSGVFGGVITQAAPTGFATTGTPVTALTKTGAGTQTLTGSNTYSGGTTVSAGTLAVNNTTGSGTGSGAVNVLSGATLGGSGSIAGSVNIANGGILAPGNSPGTLTTGALTLNAGSILNYEFGQAYVPGGALNDLTNVNGDLTLAGTLNVATSAGGAFLPGVYRVFNYSGALTDNTLNLGTAPVAASGLAVQTSVANQVNLVNSTGVSLQYWDGSAAVNHGPTGIEGNGVAEGGAGIWQGPPGNNNWTVASGVGDGPWANGAFAVFQGTAGAVTVDNVTHGPVNFQGAQFDADGYVISGGALNASTPTTLLRVGAGGAGAGTTATINSVISDVGVVGGSQLVKTDPGTLILNGVNTYAGGTAVNGGVLQVAADNNLGAAAGGLSFDTGTLRYGAAFDTARAVTLNAGGGSFDTNGNNVALTGIVSGAGSLTKTGAGTLTLANANAYGGGTALNAGTLVLGTSTSAGTGAIAMAGGTTLSAGAAGLVVANDITTAAAAQINGGAGAFTLGGTIGGAGSITSTGTGVTTFTGDNAYTGGTTITAGTLQLGNGGTTGSIVGDVTNNATLVVNRSNDSTLAGNIGGTGNLQKLGAGTLTLSGINSYGGGTALLKGRIDVGSNSALGTGALAMSDATTLGFTVDNLNIANPVSLTGTFDPIVDTGAFTETLSGAITGGGILTKNGSGTLIVSGTNNYTGATNVAQGTLRGGAANTFSAASSHVVSAGATLDTGGFNQRVASLSNSGTVSLLSTAPGSTLTVNGAYVGNGGLLRLGTALGDSSSASDRLVLDGASASATGNTTVQVTNLGGLGALTTGNGINLISALNGATTTAQTTKSAFALAGSHVDAGAFEYRLFAGDATGAGENWYLRSTTTVPVVPTTPTTPTTPATPGTPTVPTVTLPTYRAEVPMYAALPEVLRQSDLAMLSNLHRRVGDEGRPIDAAAGWGGAHRRVWARALGGTTTVAQGGTTAPESRISMAGLQAGVDMFANDTWNAGVYAGTLRSDARVNGAYGLNLFTAAYAGSLRADNMYLGGYATYANPQGQYADFVLQYGRHDITGTAAGRGAIDTDASSLTASAELGQRFALGSNWGIEPQVQLIYNRQSMERAQIGGANVDQDPAHSLIGRVGVRLTGDFMTGAGRLQPYARLNLWHGFRGTDRTSFIGPAGTASIENGIGYTSTEVAAGFTLAMTPSTSVYGEAGKLFHTGGGQAQVKSSVQGALGVRVRF